MDLAHFTLEIAVALGLGVLIGIERQFGLHTAGLRTNALVCVGAALFVSTQRLLDPHSTENRIAAQVVSGIGFLGGGVILREGFNVRGMNTAATLWCSAAIGTLAGMGLLIEGVLGTAVILTANLALRPVANRIQLRARRGAYAETLYRIRIVCPSEAEGTFRKMFFDECTIGTGFSLQSVSVQAMDNADKVVVIAELDSLQRSDELIDSLAARLGSEAGVTGVTWEKMR